MMPEIRNLFAADGLDRDAEQTEVLLARGAITLERLVSFAHPTPAGEWYDQSQTEWVALIRGVAVLVYDDGGRVELSAGDHLTIPPRVRHRVESVSEDAVWLALFL